MFEYVMASLQSALSNQVLTWGRERLFKARLSYPLQGEGEGGPDRDARQTVFAFFGALDSFFKDITTT